jgi:large subunit ribosomal protein L25
MSDMTTLQAELRAKPGKGASREARRQGKLPAVIYGNAQTPDLIAICPREFVKEMHKPGFSTRLFTIALDGKTQQTLIKDLQLHPLTDAPVHVDFLRVTSKTLVTVSVPIRFINEDKSPGLKRGGVLNIVHHEVEIKSRADAIPSSLDIDLTGVEFGHAFHLDAIQLPEGTSFASTEKGYTIATILAPKVEATAEKAE